MKKSLKLLLLIALTGSSAFAADEAMHLVVQSGGAESFYNLSEIKKLDFTSSSSEVVLHHTGGEVPLAFTDLSCLGFKQMSTVGIREEMENVKSPFTASPVPFTDYFLLQFELEGQNSLTLEVINVNGATVLSEQISGQSGFNDVRIETAHLATGIYFCILNNKGVIQTKKIVKQ